MKKFALFALLLGLITSCGDDDDIGLGGELVPPRLLSEVLEENDEELQAFLQTHFYNYEEFDAPSTDFDFKIRIDTIAGENSNKVPLLNQVETAVINVSSTEFLGLEEELDIPHTLYYLDVRSGTGEAATIADSTFVRYEGLTLDLNAFDGSSEVPVWFDLAQLHSPQTSLNGKSFRGFAEGATRFKPGGEIVVNSDGTFTVEGYGIGAIFFPSGLGNFNNSGTFDAYSPLIFKIDLFTVNSADHDGDGVPSILEDRNMNNFLYDDNSDLDVEDSFGVVRIADFLDTDDDGDGVLTRTEISDADGNIILPYPDSDGDGTPDYLDVNILRDPNN